MPGTALFANFAKGAVFEFSFHGIQTIELTSLLLTTVQTCVTVACVISNEPLLLLRPLYP